MKSTVAALAGLIYLALPGTSPAGQDLKDHMGALLDVLERQGYDLEAPAAFENLAVASARAFDPGARFFHHEQALQTYLGQPRLPALALNPSNRVFRVNGPRGTDPSETPWQPGQVLSTVNGETTEGLTLPALFQRLREHPLALTLRTGTATNTVNVDEPLLTEEPILAEETWPEDLVYVLISGLYETTGSLLAQRIRSWADQGKSGLILDLRGAGGDDTAAVAELASLFTENPEPLATLESLSDEAPVVLKPSPGETVDLPVMVLVDETTRGTAELLAALCSERLRGAVVLGRPTQGDFGLRTAVPLPDRGLLYLATRRLRVHHGKTFRGGEPVSPDILVTAASSTSAPAAPEARNHREPLDRELDHVALHHRVAGDPALARAVDILIGLKALNVKRFAPTLSSR